MSNLKLVPDPILILANNPKQQLHAKKFFLKSDILKEDYQTPLKESTLLFLLNPAFPFKNKRGLELVTSHLSGYKINSERLLY